MLAGSGIINLKQIHAFLEYDKDYGRRYQFLQTDGENTFTEMEFGWT
jgi:hypothetical protein